MHAVLLAALLAHAQPAADPVFDVPALLAPPLQAKVLKSTEQDGVVTEEVRFHSETDGGKAVEIFAYFSYPKGAKGLPAFVWNQGGLAQATTYWTVFGAKRGYATLCIDFPMPGYRSTGGYPIVSGVELGDDPKQAPIYHGAVALLRAVSFLESRKEVDRNRIGMAGSSWGGFFTTLMVGVDPRLKAGACLFGCGALDLGNQWWDGRGPDPKRDAKFRQRWRATLDPATRLAKTRTPIAWFTGTNDQFYWLPAVAESYRLAAGPKHLSLLPNYNHALTQELDEQVFAWLDVHLRGKPAFVSVKHVATKAENGRTEVYWSFAGPRKVVAAELLVSQGPDGNWVSRPWVTVPAKIKDGLCVATVPGEPAHCILSMTVIDADGFRYSTPPERLMTAANNPPRRLDFDGAGLWGGWEETQVNYLKLHGTAVPALSGDAREGKAAAAFKTGTHTLPALLFTAGEPHRLTCWLKADKAAEMTLSLRLTHDGKPAVVDKVVKVGPDWVEAELRADHPAALVGHAHAVVSVPAGVTLLVDAVSYRPILKGNPK